MLYKEDFVKMAFNAITEEEGGDLDIEGIEDICNMLKKLLMVYNGWEIDYEDKGG